MFAKQDVGVWNEQLKGKTPWEIARWAVEMGQGRSIVSTNFRPYEAVLLRLCIQVWPEIPVLWVDHGYNRPATYRHSESVAVLLNLNLKTYLPLITAAHRDAVYGPVPGPEDEEKVREFSAMMKLEPFSRGMKELAPTVWITSLRKSQNPHRAGLGVVALDENFGTIKVNPVFHLSDEEMEDSLKRNGLPNEWDYFDPAKADEKRECGLHVRWENAPGVAAGI
jgi:phosphoadenosine phosphosulfate reductase